MKSNLTGQANWCTIVLAAGMSKQGRVLIVAHTDREGQIRIISARKATRNEGRYYAAAE
jgi:hypothetical protein